MHSLIKRYFVLLLVGIAFLSQAAQELVFVGSGQRGIESFWLDTGSGALTPAAKTGNAQSADFIAVSPNRRHLYSVSESSRLVSSGVAAYDIDRETGMLKLLNQESAGGSVPCYVSMDPKGKVVLVANYGSGNVGALPVDEDGFLRPITSFFQDHGSSINASRQKDPHAHCIDCDPRGRFAFVCDLGIDKVVVFKLDASHGKLTPNEPDYALAELGAGPRHIAFHPNQRFAYVINEMANCITAYSYDRKRGKLRELENYPMLPVDFKGGSTAAEIAVHPNGKFVYASNRGEDSIVMFHCAKRSGDLTFGQRVSSEGKTPRHFEIDPSGKYLLVGDQDSDTVIVFRIDGKTGELREVSRAPAKMPKCIKILKP